MVLRSLSLFGKIFSCVVVVFIIASLISLGLLTRHQTEMMEKSLVDENVLLAQLASANIESGYFTHQWPFEILKKITEAENVIFWHVVKPNGEIYLANDAYLWGKKVKDFSPVLLKGLTIREAVREGEKIKIIINPLKIKEKNLPWTFWLGVSLKPILLARRRIILTNCLVGLMAVLFVSITAYYLTRNITRPIKNLVAGTKAIARGDLSQKIKVETKDEIGELTASFNEMTRELHRTTVSKTYAESIIETTPSPLIVLNRKLNVLSVNKEYLNVFKIKREEVLNRALKDVLPSEFLAASQLEEKIFRMLASSQTSPQRFEVTFRNSYLGEKILDCILTAVKVSTEEKTSLRAPSFLLLLNDITEKRQLELQLLQFARIATIGQLATGIAHELNNPLASVLGFTQLTLEKLSPDHPLRKRIEKVEKSAKRCRKIVQNLLNFSRQEKFQFQPVEVNSLIDATLELCEHQLSLERIKVFKNYSPSLPLIKASPSHLQQVFFNIIVNAIQATPAGGRLEIKTSICILKEAQEPFSKGQKILKIEFKDNGEGLEKEDLNRVFEPFFTTREVGEGTGLGLSISLDLILKHKGNIYAESAGKGKGATFTVCLPT